MSIFCQKLRQSNGVFLNEAESKVEQGRIMSQIGSNYGSNKVKSWVDGVESWVAQGHIMD